MKKKKNHKGGVKFRMKREAKEIRKHNTTDKKKRIQGQGNGCATGVAERGVCGGAEKERA